MTGCLVGGIIWFRQIDPLGLRRSNASRKLRALRDIVKVVFGVQFMIVDMV